MHKTYLLSHILPKNKFDLFLYIYQSFIFDKKYALFPITHKCTSNWTTTVKPVLRGHLWVKGKLAL